MIKSYKMVVLKYMLSRGLDQWLDPVTPDEVAPYLHRFLTEKEYRKRIDFSDNAAKKMWEYDKKKVARLIATMPMTKWSGSSKNLVSFEDGLFIINKSFKSLIKEIIYYWLKEISEYRLHVHFERKQKHELEIR